MDIVITIKDTDWGNVVVLSDAPSIMISPSVYEVIGKQLHVVDQPVIVFPVYETSVFAEMWEGVYLIPRRWWSAVEAKYSCVLLNDIFFERTFDKSFHEISIADITIALEKISDDAEMFESYLNHGTLVYGVLI